MVVVSLPVVWKRASPAAYRNAEHVTKQQEIWSFALTMGRRAIIFLTLAVKRDLGVGHDITIAGSCAVPIGNRAVHPIPPRRADRRSRRMLPSPL